MDRKTNSTDEIPHVDIEINEETLRVDVKKVIDLLRPDWKLDDLVFECKSTGYINKNYYCHNGDSKDGLFVRINGTKLKEILFDGAVKAMKYLHRRGIGAKLLCTFANGLVMEYLQGEPITWQVFRRVKEERNWLGAARELARYHGTTNMEDIRELGIKSYKDRFHEMREHVKATLASGVIPKEAIEGLPSVDELEELWTGIYTQLEDMNAELCFCHSDPNPTNFIITDQGPIFVDYDMCNFDFAAHNIGCFFVFVYDLPNGKLEGQPTDAEKDIFIREYLEQRRLIDPSRGPVTEKQFRYWKYVVKRGELLMMVYAVAGFIVAQVLEVNLGLNNSRLFWDRFQREKHLLQERLSE